MIKKKINDYSKLSLNFDSIRNEVNLNLSNYVSPKKNKLIAFFSLLCIIIAPVIAVLLTINLVIIIVNIVDRYSEGNKNTQTEYLASFAPNGLLELDRVSGDICWYMDEERQYAEFILFDSDFGSYYNLEYLKGKIREHPNNEYVEIEHGYNDCVDFYRDIFEIKLDVSEYEMDIKYQNKLTEKQKVILVTCKLEGDSQLLLNFKYRDEKIFINDVTIRYNYYLDEDSFQYDSNDIINIEISFIYNENEYILYGSKRKID